MSAPKRLFVFSFLCFLMSTASAHANTLYVDPQLSSTSCTTYSPASRSCTGGTDTAYKVLNTASGAANPGDTVYVRAGTFTAAFAPSKSGTDGNLITFQNYNGETATISGTNLDPAINLTDRQYLVIDGLTVSNVGAWLDGTNTTHVTLQNNRFLGPVGAFTASSFLDSHYNTFLNNTFQDSNGDSLTMFRSDYNRIEGNTFTDADHSLMSIKCGDFNIVRSNTFSNSRQKASEAFDCDATAGGVPVTQVNSTTHNLFEGNQYTLTAADDGGGPYAGIQYAAQHGVFRHNIFYNNQGFGIDFTLYGGEAQYDHSNRFYHNVLYNNTGGLHTKSGSTSQYYDNVLKNNVLYKNKSIPIPWNDDKLGGSQMDNDLTSVILVQNNNFFNNTAGELTIQINFVNRSVAQAQSTYPTTYLGNLDVDPGFVDAVNHDFHLLSNSLLIDAGAFLTTTVSAGSGTSLPVVDAGYFFDGYGISGQVGDLIQLSGQTQTARIVSANYSTHVLTLDRSLTWSANQGVSLAYSGAAPDMGAFEYGAIVPPPPPPPSGSACDVNNDGATNVVDVQLCANMALGVSSCTADINQDGTCNVIDVQRVVNNALGGQCVTQ